MNPYESLPTDLESKTPKPKRSRTQWSAIATAFVVQVGLSIIFIVALNHETWIDELTILLVCFGLPWFCGTLCLSYLVKSNWIKHGLIYALICPLLIFVLQQEEFGFVVIVFFIICQLFAILLTLSTMAVLRKAATAKHPS